jgi:hypothetical protein
MARPASRRDEDNIDADIIARLGIMMSDHRRCRSDAPQTVRVNRGIKISYNRSRFDLNKGRRSATPCDQVNLAAAQFDPARKDPPAVKAQPPSRSALPPSAKTLCLLAGFRRIHPRGRAIARS